MNCAFVGPHEEGEQAAAVPDNAGRENERWENERWELKVGSLGERLRPWLASLGQSWPTPGRWNEG